MLGSGQGTMPGTTSSATFGWMKHGAACGVAVWVRVEGRVRSGAGRTEPQKPQQHCQLHLATRIAAAPASLYHPQQYTYTHTHTCCHTHIVFLVLFNTHQGSYLVCGGMS